MLLLLLTAFRAAAQEEEILRAARFLSGAASEEEVDEDWITRLEALGGRLIRLNSAHPRADGLLTDYQLASLADYRSRAGDILSWEELALVDGFSHEWVAAMKPFLSLASNRLPGVTDTVRLRANTLVRSTLKNLGLKTRLGAEHWRAGAAWRTGDGTFFAEGNWRGHRLVLGDYNLRLGQGLALWSGFSMESLSTVDAFLRRTTGLTPVWSYSSASVHRGAAYQYASTHWRGYAFASLNGTFGGHLDWLGRQGQAGLSAAWDGGLLLSADTRWNLRGTDYAAEVALRKGSPAALLAVRRSSGKLKWALHGRFLPSRYSGKKYGEYALAAGAAYKSGKWSALAGQTGFGSSVPTHQASLTVDAALLPVPLTAPGRLQIRLWGGWQWQAAPECNLDVRLTGRYRNYEAPRTALRGTFGFSQPPFLAAFRIEAVHCEQFGWLSYLEGGYKNAKVAAYLRLTGFFAEQWACRIWCYERDAPGTFSVPAYSGRGCTLSLMGSWKHRFGRRLTLKAYLRAGWMLRIGHMPAPTLNFQLNCDL